MISAKASLVILSIAVLISSSVCGATIVQTNGTFVSFNAEIGTLNDGSADGTKFDVMAPDGGSFSDYLSVETLNGTVSFDVDFMDTATYLVFVRYRETTNNTPNVELTFNGTTKGSDIFVAPSSFDWVHLSNSDFNPVNAPGVAETVTLRAAGGSDFDIDAVALISRIEYNSGRFAVNDTNIPESSFVIPEPSTALFLLTGPMLLLRRRRC